MINAGSSSVKFALFAIRRPMKRTLSAQLERLTPRDGSKADRWIASVIDRVGIASVVAVGHRVVHGLDRSDAEPVTPRLLRDLRKIFPYDPDHLPQEVKLMQALMSRYPRLPQVACFDTAFHHSMPRVARIVAIPRRYDARGVRRYGFHGLSYSYLLDELARVAGRAAARGRVVLAHLGNGASLAATLGRKSIDTTMGFTPAAGVPMGTRSGDLDPGVAWYLMRTDSLSPRRFNQLINAESGLLGISETSSDMRDLLKRSRSDVRAAEAVNVFCYQVRKAIGALAAALGGIDTLVFSGGIGENSPEVRRRICQRLGFLGINIDDKRNRNGAPAISQDGSPTAVRVIPTDEERQIAELTLKRLARDRASGRTRL